MSLLVIVIIAGGVAWLAGSFLVGVAVGRAFALGDEPVEPLGCSEKALILAALDATGDEAEELWGEAA